MFRGANISGDLFPLPLPQKNKNKIK